ncbi:MAG TPA: hypothetical protein V6C90_07115 [Coleofasciculaceae cyanobacterium]
MRKILVNLWISRTLRAWQGTLDYIFLSQHLRVRNCQHILTKPALNDRTLYSSDHFGIAGELELKW